MSLEPRLNGELQLIRRDQLDVIGMVHYVNNQMCEVLKIRSTGHWTEDKVTSIRNLLECKYQEYCKHLAQGLPANTAYTTLIATITKVGIEVQEA